MKRPIVLAAGAAILLFGACVFLLREGSDPEASAQKDGLRLGAARAEAPLARSAIEVVGRIYDPAAIRVRARLENPRPQRSERRPG